MPDDSILPRLHTFVAETILEGHDAGLDASTRLLELGVLNSMEIVRLTAFIENRFGVAVPMEMILAENFQTLETIAAMVSRLSGESGSAQSATADRETNTERAPDKIG